MLVDHLAARPVRREPLPGGLKLFVVGLVFELFACCRVPERVGSRVACRGLHAVRSLAGRRTPLAVLQVTSLFSSLSLL